MIGVFYIKNMEYLTIEDFPKYEININGEIRNKITGRIMKQSMDHFGFYLKVHLNKNTGERSKNLFVHVLIAKTFVANPENKPIVDHINRIKTDNKIENLRWVTFKENSENVDYNKIDRKQNKKRKRSKILKGVYLTPENKWTVKLSKYKKKEFSNAKVLF